MRGNKRLVASMFLVAAMLLLGTTTADKIGETKPYINSFTISETTAPAGSYTNNAYYGFAAKRPGIFFGANGDSIKEVPWVAIRNSGAYATTIRVCSKYIPGGGDNATYPDTVNYISFSLKSGESWSSEGVPVYLFYADTDTELGFLAWD